MGKFCVSYMFLFIVQTAWTSESIGRPLKFDKPDIVNVLIGHNHLRTHNATPVAADMRRITWDEELAELSKKWTTRCRYERHSEASVERWNDLGQSFYKSQPAENWTNEFHFSALLKWLWQKKLYDYENQTCVENSYCLEYLNLMSSRSYKVGCGASQCDKFFVGNEVVNNTIFYMCAYGPKANYTRQHLIQPYLAGEPCTACDINDTCALKMCQNSDRDAMVPFTSKRKSGANGENAGSIVGAIVGSILGAVVVGGATAGVVTYYKKHHKVSPENNAKESSSDMEERNETGDGNSRPSSPVIEAKNKPSHRTNQRAPATAKEDTSKENNHTPLS